MCTSVPVWRTVHAPFHRRRLIADNAAVVALKFPFSFRARRLNFVILAAACFRQQRPLAAHTSNFRKSCGERHSQVHKIEVWEVLFRGASLLSLPICSSVRDWCSCVSLGHNFTLNDSRKRQVSSKPSGRHTAEHADACMQMCRRNDLDGEASSVRGRACLARTALVPRFRTCVTGPHNMLPNVPLGLRFAAHSVSHVCTAAGRAAEDQTALQLRPWTFSKCSSRGGS